MRLPWESSAFFLQRVVNVVEGMPNHDSWATLKEAVESILKLSDLVCERSGLARYTFGEPYPQARLPKEIADTLDYYRQRVTFSDSDLRAHGVSIEQLAPFIFDQRTSRLLLKASLSHSPLLHRPLLKGSGQLVVALPTAISIAIRSLLLMSVIRVGMTSTLLEAIADDYRQFFANDPPLRDGRHAPIHFRTREHGVTASYAYKVDTGRYLHVVMVLDSLKDFEVTGFAGTNEDCFALCSALDDEVAECRAAMLRHDDFREGLTLIIGCGIGRAEAYALSNREHADWRMAYLSAADVATLNLLGDVKPLTLWRIIDAKQRLTEQGVDLFNINGLLNLVSWVRSLKGHILPHSQVPDDFGRGRRCRLVIDACMVRDLRLEVARAVDYHAVPTVDGVWVDVHKTNDSLFEEDRSCPLYVERKWDDQCGFRIVYLTPLRSWWCEVTYPRDYDRWKMMNSWLPRIAKVLDSELADLPTGPLLLQVRFRGYGGDSSGAEPVGANDIQERIRVEVDVSRSLVKIETDELFERGLADPRNISERALVGAVVTGFRRLAGKDESDRSYRDRIVRDDHARDSHHFQAKGFRDYIRESLPEFPSMIDPIDDATLRLGLGWKVRQRDDGGQIEGKAACTAFLNSLVKSMEDELCSDLKGFDRASVIKRALENHESAMANQSRWRRTSAAILALHDNKAAAMATFYDQAFKNNAALQASRVLVEVAVCECPRRGGAIPGKLDLSRLMAKLMLVQVFGGWSDAIHLDAMAPIVRVTPLGDVHVDHAFLDDVMTPFGKATHENIVRSSIEDYAENFEQPAVGDPVTSIFEADFVHAWMEEHEFPFDDFRQVADALEDRGIQSNQAVLTMRKSELSAMLAPIPNGVSVAEKLATRPRPSWRSLPEGVSDKERQPWKFRRRLSLLRGPIVQLDDADDPTLVIAPGLVRDGIVYSVKGYHEGSFPHRQLKSAAMQSWSGKVADRRGRDLTSSVAARLESLGWKTEVEVSVKKIVGKGLERDYGDVDVLASHEATRRVLLVECKDVHFHKTPGEIAEQLRDFRGEVRGGERDLLAKHLDRCDVLCAHSGRVASYLSLREPVSIESWLIFRNPVPMLFAWKELAERVNIAILDQIEQALGQAVV